MITAGGKPLDYLRYIKEQSFYLVNLITEQESIFLIDAVAYVRGERDGIPPPRKKKVMKKGEKEGKREK